MDRSQRNTLLGFCLFLVVLLVVVVYGANVTSGMKVGIVASWDERSLNVTVVGVAQGAMVWEPCGVRYETVPYTPSALTPREGLVVHYYVVENFVFRSVDYRILSYGGPIVPDERC